jgi:hypothetical protein
MEMYSLTPSGIRLARSTNGVVDPNNKDYGKWRTIFALKFLHNADKNMIASYSNLPIETVSLALTSLQQKNLVQGESKGGANEFI